MVVIPAFRERRPARWGVAVGEAAPVPPLSVPSSSGSAGSGGNAGDRDASGAAGGDMAFSGDDSGGASAWTSGAEASAAPEGCQAVGFCCHLNGSGGAEAALAAAGHSGCSGEPRPGDEGEAEEEAIGLAKRGSSATRGREGRLAKDGPPSRASGRASS